MNNTVRGLLLLALAAFAYPLSAQQGGNNGKGGSGLPSGGSVGQCVVNTGPGAGGWNSCATGAVSVTGSPAAGEITKFSAGSTITSGDLSGDVTTSGSLVTIVGEIGGVGVLNWLADNTPSQIAETSCQLAATANVATLSGLPFIDNINGVAGNCILLTHQTTGSQNGPWIMASGSWTRPVWYASGSTTQAVIGLTLPPITTGAQYQGSVWYLSTSGTITIDTTGTTWNRLPPTALAAGSSVARSIDSRAGDTANLLDYEPASGGGPSGIMRFFPNGSAPQCTPSSGSVTLSQAFPTAWNGATIFLPLCGNPGAASWTVQSPGSGYVPQDTPSLTSGTSTTTGQLVVYSTAIQSATVLNGGTSCAGTSATLTGTTGLAGTTGTAYFTAAATVSGGVVTAINSITANGPYWQNPVTSAGVPFTGAISGTTLTVTAVSGPPYNALGVGSQITGTGVTGSTAVTGLINVNSVSGVGTYTVNNSQTVASETMLTAGEPVTGDSCVGTVLSVSMGLNSGAVYVAGNYTSTPSNPITLTGGSGSSGTVNVTWEGNPLVTTVTGGAGTGNITVSPVAQSTSTGATQTWVEAWFPSELDDTAFTNMIASGKQHMVLNSLGLASGWNMCYAIGAGHSLPTLYPYDLDGQHECVIGVAQTAGGMFTMANGGFRQNIGSSIHDTLLDGLGFFQRNITMTGWDQWAYGNTLRNAYGVNVGFEGGSVFESHVLNTTIINDASVMLTMPANAIEVEHQDNRVGPNVTIQGFQNCAVFTSNVGDINVTDVHAYGGIENTFCLNDVGSVDTALYPDSVAPAFAGVVIAGYLTLQGVYIHNAGSYAGQQGVLIEGPHVQLSGLTGGNGLPDSQTIVNLGGNTNTITGNSVPTAANVVAYPTLNGIMPSLLSGNGNCSITGTFPNQTITCSGGSGTPGGSSGQVQYNNAGAFGGITTTGTGNAVLATGPTLTLPNATGLPISTGVSGLGTGVATFLATPSSANLAAALTDESGTGVAAFNISALLTTPELKGSSTGFTTIASANASASNFTATLPAATDTIVELAATQTLTNKTLTSPTIATAMTLSWLSGTAQCLVETAGVVSSTSCGGAGTTFQANGTGLSSSTTVNFENGAGIAVTNPSAGNVQFAASYSLRDVPGTTDTILSTDCANGVRYTSSSAVAVALPQATSSFATCNVDIIAYGTGTVTVTPSTSTINGASTLAITSSLSANITADTGNYIATGTATAPAGGSGNVSNSGTPTVHQTGVWVTSTTLAGVGPGTTGQAYASTGASTDPIFTATLGGVTSVNGTTIPPSATLLTSGGALGTPSSGTASNLTGLPVGGIASMGADTIAGNATGSGASPAAVAIGALNMAALQATTTFTITPTGCTPSAHAGGAFAGTITLATGPCTSIVVTINGAAGFTTTTGYHCSVGDKTTQNAGTWIPEWGESASSATTATIPIPAAAGATDVVSFECRPY